MPEHIRLLSLGLTDGLRSSDRGFRRHWNGLSTQCLLPSTVGLVNQVAFSNLNDPANLSIWINGLLKALVAICSSNRDLAIVGAGICISERLASWSDMGRGYWSCGRQ
jgi:hypothetical protein